MKPYYDDRGAGITLYHCTAEELLTALPAQSIDLVLTDPPYAEETHTGARTTRPGMRGSVPLLDFDCITIEDLRQTFDAIGRVAKGWVVSFMDWHHIASLEQQPPAGLRFVRFGIFVKPNGTPQFTGDRPATGWEGICILHARGGRMQWNGGGKRAVWTYNRQNEEHKTAKPLPLVKELMLLFSNRGDLVCDPFMGGGTTARACADLGLRFVGCDIEEKWVEATARRLSQQAMPL